MEAGIESVGSLRLLAQAGGLEVMRQSILKDATVWITPAEDVETLEFFYILSGALEMKVDGSRLRQATPFMYMAFGMSFSSARDNPQSFFTLPTARCSIPCSVFRTI